MNREKQNGTTLGLRAVYVRLAGKFAPVYAKRLCYMRNKINFQRTADLEAVSGSQYKALFTLCDGAVRSTAWSIAVMSYDVMCSSY